MLSVFIITIFSLRKQYSKYIFTGKMSQSFCDVTWYYRTKSHANFLIKQTFYFEFYAVFRTSQNFHVASSHVVLALPNQELSVLYGGPTLNYGEQLSLYVPYMLSVNMTRDLAHLQLSDLQGETWPICRESDLQGERMLICRT